MMKKIPQGRRLEGHEPEQTPEQLKEMLTPMMKDCEAKCPGVVDGMVAYSGLGQAMAGPNPGEAIKAFCPNLDLVACAEANKDVCDMGGGDDDHEEGSAPAPAPETEGGDRRLEGHGGDEDGDD